MDVKDYIKIFEQSSELLVVIDTNFVIVAASDAFLKATTTVRENIVGRNAFDVFPDNPDDKTANGESIARASFNRAIKNKTKDVLPVVKYDIPKPESEGGGYELKYWQATSSPILDENNNVKYIIHRTEDVTENKILITQLEFDKKALKLLEDSEKRYNMMLMQSPFAFAILKGKNKVITFANDKIKATWGKGNYVEGKALIAVLPELKDTAFPNLLDEVYKTGIPYYANEVLAPKYINGQKEDVYYNFVYQPYLEADETISGVTIIAAEVTAAVKVKKALEAQHEVEQKASKQLEDSEKRYNMMLMKSPFGFAILKGENMVITLANDSIKTFWGKGTDLEGKPLFEVIAELKDSEFPSLLNKVYTTGIPFYGDELLAPVFRNGKHEEVYFNFVYQPYLEADETISGVTIIAFEVTAQVIVKKALEAQQEAEKKVLKYVE
ncbi:MAG: PAS domain-containing protein [Flavobacterium sp.]|nr:PAS domain-containing protein [Flavobacterium sp.]